MGCRFEIYDDSLIMTRTGWPLYAPHAIPVGDIREFAENLLLLADGKVDSFVIGGEEE